jgi:hypothetical protein
VSDECKRISDEWLKSYSQMSGEFVWIAQIAAELIAARARVAELEQRYKFSGRTCTLSVPQSSAPPKPEPQTGEWEE